LTNYGIYDVDVQGLTGKKVEVKFFPKDTIKTISFETAGTLDFDVDIKIGVTNNTTVTAEGAAFSAPLSFKVPSEQANEAKQIVNLVKIHYLL
ncbi:MAG: PH domain-containing protein, partial [Methanosphaera sp.]|nr:PH domain-containing protein [Methanosphaera sp.]